MLKTLSLRRTDDALVLEATGVDVRLEPAELLALAARLELEARALLAELRPIGKPVLRLVASR